MKIGENIKNKAVYSYESSVYKVYIRDGYCVKLHNFRRLYV